MKNSFKETTIVYSGLFLFFCFMCVLSFLSEGTYESGDSIQHFLISKYSFHYPELFLHHWGKPFFTLVSSPFSQFGFVGINIFNALCASLTGLFVYRICTFLQIKNSWATVIFALFTPIYFIVIISGLTEIFFGMLLCLSVLLTLRKQYMAAAVIISVLPFVRSEGWLMFPLFFFIFLYRKQFSAIPVLGTGFIAYSLIGYFYFDDILWIIRQNPYQGAKDIYGSGPLFWFFSKNEFILGTALVVLFLLGLGHYIFKKQSLPEELLLILGGFAIYFVTHSYFWHKGIFGSLGLIRVMAAVTPLAAIVALRGLNILLDVIKNHRLQKTMLGIILILVVWMPFKQHRLPVPLYYEDALIKQAAMWIKENKLSDKKTASLHPYIPFFLDKNPFDKQTFLELWRTNLDAVQKNDIVIWDSHFCPNEGNIPLDTLLNNKNYFLHKKISSDNTHKKLFEVYIFEYM